MCRRHLTCRLSAAALVALGISLAAGCSRSTAPTAGAGPVEPTPAASESEVIRVEPMVALGEPGPANLVVTPTDEDSSEFVIKEESGQVHSGEVTVDNDVTAEDLDLPVPEGAVRLAGAEVENLESTNPVVDPSLSGSLAVVYESSKPVDEVVAFYADHESGRFTEVEADLLGQAGWRMLFDGESDRVIGVTKSPSGMTQITLLDIPAGP